MTALTRERASSIERWTYHLFPLAATKKAWKGGIAAFELGTGKVVPAAADTDHLVIGKFADSVDATEGERKVNVNLGMEIEVEWWSNDAGSPVAADDLGMLRYVLDDQTASMATTGPVLGRVWAVDPTRGVAVQKLGSYAPAP